MILKRSNQKKLKDRVFHTVPGSIRIPTSKIKDILKKEDVTFANYEASRAFIEVLRLEEPKRLCWKGEISFLNRIIRAGGFTSYINQLQG